MQPLEEFYYFAQVVEHGGYAKAARALGIPKSRLSRHVAALEAKLNVRLLQRSTRRFAITEVGRDVHRHATAMLAEADAALQVVEFARAEPRGVVRISCPVPMARTMLAGIVPEFLHQHPKVRLQIHVTNRRVDVLNEGFDIALRVRVQPTGEDGLVMRSFGESRELLVASPDYLDRAGRPNEPAELAEHDTLAFDSEADQQIWELRGPDSQVARIEITPRVCCHDFVVLRATALEGLGITKLPGNVVRADLADGKLERVLPEWNTPLGVAHLVFPTRRGLLPAVRALIDFLAAKLPAAVGQ
jgi:DNA-binding transcriptional LysR family regulator